MKKFFGFLVLVSICFFSCHTKKKENRTHNHSNRILNTIFASSVRSLDPRVGNEYPSAFMISTLFEGLMRKDKNDHVIPGVAESYEISDDQKTYTFHLRESYWTNGDPVTAYDFEYAWKKAVNPKYAMTGAFTFYSIKNVAACLQNKVNVDEVGVKALDEHTLVVELEHPANYFLSLTTCSTYMPINKRIDEKQPNWASELTSAFTCNGPFLLSKWKKNDSILLHKNPMYWDQEHVKLAGINIQIIEDNMTPIYLFEKKELDWVGAPLAAAFPPEILKNAPLKEKLKGIENYSLYWIFLNTEKYPLNNKNFRKALSYAINRKSIVEHVLQMGERPAMGILAKGISVQDEPYFEDGNKELARRHFELALEELGLTRETFPKICLSLPKISISHSMNQAIQQQWNEVLGIQIELEELEFPILFNKLSKGGYSMGQIGWVSWLEDPIYMLETFRNKSLATNMCRWENQRYRELLDLSDIEIDIEKRKNLLREAESLLMEEMPIIPLCFTKDSYLQIPELKGVSVTPILSIDFKWAYFEEDEK